MSPHRGHGRLSRRFYARPPGEVARALLGKLLVHGDRAGVIVEAEAYLGADDLASHARFGETARNAVMFGPAGVAYVYLCYGVHHMFNVVAHRAGTPGAVLIRALAPRSAAGEMSWARGPGKLARALDLTRAHNGVDLTRGGRLFIARGAGSMRVPAARIRTGPRVGVGYAGEWAKAPLRFWIDGHPAVTGTGTRTRTRTRRER